MMYGLVQFLIRTGGWKEEECVFQTCGNEMCGNPDHFRSVPRGTVEDEQECLNPLHMEVVKAESPDS